MADKNAGANLAKNDPKKDPKKKFSAKAIRFFKDMKGEVKKVVWPNKKQIINSTTVVVVMSVCAAVFVGGFDLILGFLVKMFLRNA